MPSALSDGTVHDLASQLGLQTSFEQCGLLPRTSRGPRGLPCRGDEEESCNEVHATCARSLKEGFEADPEDKKFLRAKPPCEPVETKRAGVAAEGQKKRKGFLKRAARAARKIAGIVSAKSGECNARMVDMPAGLSNPEARGSARLPAGRQILPLTVWGIAVHGLSGTFSFDSHGSHAADYIFEVPQPGGLPSDYYICDSRERPQVCALLGGNMKHACAEFYDPQQCSFCEDHGSKLKCSIRGWNMKTRKWARVPIYPRDLLGELYRGEWRDVFARPLWASIELPKAGLKDVKKLPDYMLAPGPASKAVQMPRPTKTPHRVNVLASSMHLLALQRPPGPPSRNQVLAAFL